MIATLYKLPTWIMEENKPSYNLFIQLLEQATQENINCETIEYPTLTTLQVRSSLTLNNWNVYNYININNLWYRIVDVSYISANNNVVNIDGEIDIYLSYLLKYFDVNNLFAYGQVVFFKQKHLNRWYYNSSGNQVINFEQQFYLKNKHKNLADLGKNPVKVCDGALSEWYSTNDNTVNYSSATLTTLYGSGYIYALFNITAQETSQTFYNQMPVNGLVNVGINIDSGTVNGQDGVGYGLPWWVMLINVGSSAYTDYIVLPLPIEYAYIMDNDLNFQQTINNGSLTTTDKICPGIVKTTNWIGSNNVIAWTVNPQNLYFIYNANNNGSVAFPKTQTPFTNIFNFEPYLFQYCNFRVRGAGEDSMVDLTSFNNVTPTTYISTLYSFCINLNHPTTQITNILYDYLQYQVEAMIPYMYNSISDCFYCLNWKLIYPSASNNWSNYMDTNLNQYHTALNIAHYGLQKSQADLAFSSFDLGWSFFSGGISGLEKGIENETNSVFNEKTQQQEYNYLKTGKKQDMTRTANERLATNNNAIAYNNFLVSFVFEYPPMYEQLIAINYCILNGYLLDKWLPFNYWYNRKVVNYVSCSYFADVMLPNMNLTYKKAIDKLFNDGFRVWCVNDNITNWNTLPTFETLYGQGENYINVEVNTNNNEINILTQGQNNNG